MVNPITGPYSRSRVSASLAESRVWSRQAPPYNLPLPGSHRLVVNTGWNSDPATVPNGPSVWPHTTGLDQLLDAAALNRARSRVVGEALEQLKQCDAASLGVALVQYSQAERTIVQRSRQLLGFSRSLLRRDLRGALAHLSVGADQYRDRIPQMPRTERAISQGWRSAAREYGGAWLEWNWGVAPTVDDIVKSVDILNSEHHTTVTLNTLNDDKSIKRTGVSNSQAFLVRSISPYPFSQNYREEGRVYTKLTGTARLKQPNRLLYNQLGLDEPLKIGFEVIPWSFLLSWVSNLEIYLDNWSPLRELYVWENLCTTEGKQSSLYEWWNSYPGGFRNFTIRHNRRSVGNTLPTVAFQFKPLRFKPQRAANAIALLSTFFREVGR